MSGVARAMQRQMQLQREEGRLQGHQEGLAIGEEKATAEIVEFMRKAIPANQKEALQAVDDIEAGEHKKGDDVKPSPKEEEPVEVAEPIAAKEPESDK